MHPWILKKAEAQDQNVRAGAKILANVVIPYSTWSCESYIRLLMRYGRGIWHFLHWMTRKGYLPSIAPLRKGRKGIENRLLHMRHGDPEAGAYAGDPKEDVRRWMKYRLKGNEPVLEFIARTDPSEYIRQGAASVADVTSVAFRILSVDESRWVRAETCRRAPPVLGESMTYEWLFASGAPRESLEWFRYKYPHGIPVSELKQKEVLDRLYWEWWDFSDGTDPIWDHVLRIYHGKV